MKVLSINSHAFEKVGPHQFFQDSFKPKQDVTTSVIELKAYQMGL